MEYDTYYIHIYRNHASQKNHNNLENLVKVCKFLVLDALHGV